jgi:hypothetical protein
MLSGKTRNGSRPRERPQIKTATGLACRRLAEEWTMKKHGKLLLEIVVFWTVKVKIVIIW